MKKMLIIGLVAFCFVGFTGIVNAATTVDQTWSGSGVFNTVFTAGDDSETVFNTMGASISGEFHSKDSDNNPYGYGVDSTESKVKAHVENGFIEYRFTKNDNYEPMYGAAGQESYTLIDTAGTGDFAWRTTSNFAQMRCSNYGWQSNDQMKATGLHHIYHYFSINENEGAEMDVIADGSTEITDMSEDHSGSSFKFGKGCGCYTNANVDIVGSGSFALDAYADNQITTDTGITVSGPGSHYAVQAAFGTGFHFSNFALSGN